MAHIKSLSKIQEGNSDAHSPERADSRSAKMSPTNAAPPDAHPSPTCSTSANHNYRMEWCVGCLKPADERCARHERMPLTKVREDTRGNRLSMSCYKMLQSTKTAGKSIGPALGHLNRRLRSLSRSGSTLGITAY